MPKSPYSLLVVYLFVVGYMLPIIVNRAPQGTDVFTHLFYINQMVDTYSLEEFYYKCMENQFIGYRYPFGLWLFDSVVAKVSGLKIIYLALVLPLLFLFIILVLYSVYVRGYNLDKTHASLSLLFLVTSPGAAVGILQHTPSVFVLPLLFVIFYSLIKPDKKVVLIALFVFIILPYTHAGSFMFMLYFVISFNFVYALIKGKFHFRSFIYLVFMMFSYLAFMNIFPYVHNQYINKARLIISVTELFPIPYLHMVGNIIYENIFLKLDMIYFLMFLGLIYGFSNGMIYLNIVLKRAYNWWKERSEIPALVGITSLSHTLPYWPIWLGPIHVLLALFGAFKNRTVLIMLISIAIVVVPSAYYAEERALRELAYFRFVIPIAATFGYIVILEKIKNNLRNVHIIRAFLLTLFFVILIVTVITGMYYFYPKISGDKHVVSGLEWLSKVGNPNEGAASYALRHRISVYGDKLPPDVTFLGHGSELRRYGNDLKNIYYSDTNSEMYAKDLYATFGVKYIILWDKIFRISRLPPNSLKIDANTQLDKIYSSMRYFSIYRYIEEQIKFTNIHDTFSFNENVTIKDAGDSYLINTEIYKVRLSKSTPTIIYLGNSTTNFLGEGGIYDYVRLEVYRGYMEKTSGFVTQELPFDKVIVGKNKIIYQTIFSVNGQEWSTVIFEYTFFKKSIRKKIMIANDWLNNSTMNVKINTIYLTPLDTFEVWDANGKIHKRKIYKSEDTVYIKNIKYKQLFIGNLSKLGIFMYFEKDVPYPTMIAYQGFTKYNYYKIDVRTSGELYPAESFKWIQWITLGNESTVTENVQQYNIKLLPYMGGKIPIAILSLISPFDNNSTLGTKILEDYGLRVVKMIKVNELNESIVRQLDADAEFILYVDRKTSMSKLVEAIELFRKLEKTISGVFFEDLTYSLEALRLLSKYGILYIVDHEVLPPYDILFQEGHRHFRTSYINGNVGQIVLIPYSLPKLKGPLYFYSDPLSAYYAVAISAIEYGDPIVLRFDGSKILDEKYQNIVLDFASYIKSKGNLYPVFLSDLVETFKKLDNVYLNISQASDKIVIKTYNDNNASVNFTIELNLLKSEYVVENATMSRQVCEIKYCTYYISTDLKSKEYKYITISKSSKRK